MMTPELLILVALGGAFGAVARFGIGVCVLRLSALELPFLSIWGATLWREFPIATFGVNIVGSFFIGLLSAWLLQGNSGSEIFPTALRDGQTKYHAPVRAFLIVGLLGGFTTFSTFSLELFQLIEKRELIQVGFYAVGSVFLGVLAVFAGFSAFRALSG